MNLKQILFAAKRNTHDLTSKAAAEYIGIQQGRFADWLRYEKSNRFPNETYLVKVAELAKVDYFTAWVALQAARTEIPELREKLKSLAA
jgi:hypothetical protein